MSFQRAVRDALGLDISVAMSFHGVLAVLSSMSLASCSGVQVSASLLLGASAFFSSVGFWSALP
ncbi:hypothetical protein BDZ85DRAFT_262717 [Elsinoe ampelina]|uniref:Uncharacterized protein n=1 Tax=Elsinoe ampelina TaxID=302913 RepID=A0A6A6GB55_9PEZI|nr:hypothetical protein BDZ85DRAFT_262717 [Elsinoe ampelina]